MTLAGKVVAVTGAAQGIGRAYVLALARAGATVVASSRSMGAIAPDGGALPAGSLAETVQLATAAGGRAHGMICDVGDEAQIDRFAREVIGNHGRIDMIVNNAATYPGAHANPNFDPFALTASEWDLYFRVNVLGAYYLTSRLAPYMIARKSGSIVNVTSSAGIGSTHGSADHFGMLGYSVTKAALNRMTLFFAEELRQHGIAVNALNPGSVMTSAWRAVPQDMKDAALKAGTAKPANEAAMGDHIVYLAEQSADTLTGQVLDADDFGVKWARKPA